MVESSIPLAKQVIQAQSIAVTLDVDQERRFQRLVEETTMIDLHQHPMVKPENPASSWSACVVTVSRPQRCGSVATEPSLNCRRVTGTCTHQSGRNLIDVPKLWRPIWSTAVNRKCLTPKDLGPRP